MSCLFTLFTWAKTHARGRNVYLSQLIKALYPQSPPPHLCSWLAIKPHKPIWKFTCLSPVLSSHLTLCQLESTLSDITIHKACYSLYFIGSRADIKADGFSLNPLKTSDGEWLCSIFLKKHFNTAAFMYECLPSVTDIESVDCCMTSRHKSSNESDEVLLHSACLI